MRAPAPVDSSPPGPPGSSRRAAFRSFVARLRAHPRGAALLATLCAIAGLLMGFGWVPDSSWRSEGQRLFRAWSAASLWFALAGFCAHASYRGLRERGRRGRASR